MKRLVLCADDFALHAPASEGIAELAGAGHLSATSVMTLSPRWPRDVRWLEPLRGQLDVGLHLDWTSEFAEQAGHGMSLARTMASAWLGRLSAPLARPVIERQLDAFEQHWQAIPDHIDGHQHVQQFAGIRQALLEVMSRRYGGASTRPYLRISQLPGAQPDLKSRVIAAMGAQRLRALAQAAGFACAPALSGVYDFSDQPLSYPQRMAHWLDASPEGTLLMCHPARQAPADDVIGAARVREFEHLGSAEFQAQLQASGVTLTRGALLYQDHHQHPYQDRSA